MTGRGSPRFVIALLLVLAACAQDPEIAARDRMCAAFDHVTSLFGEAQGAIGGGQPDEVDFDELDAAIEELEAAAREYDRVNDTRAARNAVEQLPVDLAAGGGNGLNYFLTICEPYFEEHPL
jgi:hypothetical protein